MSIRSIVSRSLLAATFVTIAGTAFARQPPALTMAQRAADREIACEGAAAVPGAGYRDSTARFGDAAASPTALTAGYRDAYARSAQARVVHVACTMPSHEPGRTATARR